MAHVSVSLLDVSLQTHPQLHIFGTLLKCHDAQQLFIIMHITTCQYLAVAGTDATHSSQFSIHKLRKLINNSIQPFRLLNFPGIWSISDSTVYGVSYQKTGLISNYISYFYPLALLHSKMRFTIYNLHDSSEDDYAVVLAKLRVTSWPLNQCLLLW